MMIPILYILAVTTMSAQSALSKQGGRLKADPFRFNFYKAAFALLLFLTAFLISERTLHAPTIIYGALYGVCITVSMYCGYRALCIGPLSLTSMLATFSLIVPCIYGAVFLHEAISLLAGLGFVCLVISLVCLNIKDKKDDKKPSLEWAVCIIATILMNGISSVIQKEHQLAFPGGYRFTFMSASMLVCTLSYTVICLIKSSLIVLPTKADLFGGGSGILNGLSNFFTLWLAGMSPASILFPLISASTMLMALLVGKFIFKEKLTVYQIIGFFVGILSVFLLNMR